MENLSKRASILMMIALLTATLGMCGDSVIIPGADQMFKAYQDDTFVNFLLSGPNLVSMFASILAGMLLRYIDPKKMLVLGMALFFIGGTFGAAIDNEPFMIAMRCLVGLALGFTNVTAMTIITVMYIDENRRSRMVGVLNAGMFCSATILTALSGVIAQAYGFKAMFYLYAIGIVSIALIIFFVPKSSKQATTEESQSLSTDKTESEAGRKGWLIQFIILCVGYLIFQISYAVIVFFISVYADEKGLGGPAFAGTLTSTLFIGALIASFAFGFIYPKLKRNTMLISFAFLVIGYCLFIFVPATVPVIIGCLLFGYANANALSQAMMRAGLIAPGNNASLAVSIIAAVMGVGFFLSTYTVQVVKMIMGVDTFVAIMPLFLIIGIILLILTIVYLLATKKQEAALTK